MSDREIDRVRAKSALEVVRQHPGMVVFAVSPALVLLGVIWWLAGVGWTILAAVLLLLAGTAVVVVKR